MFKMLVDTCVWLDLAKDPQQQVLLSVIEELIQMHELELIVPTIILDEFKNNKVRIIEESSRSLSSHFKRVKDAVDKFGDPKKKQDILFQLNDVDHKIPLVGASTASSAVSRIEKLLRSSPIEITNDVKLRAAQRAIDQKAPFHRKKNSINDALLIESYSDFVLNKNSVGIRFAFVTHNTQDFSNPTESNKLPHPDIAVLFSKRKSLYFISFAEAIHRVQPDLVPDIMLEHDEWSDDPRGLSEILDVEKELTDKIWYNRHHSWLHKIATGQHKIVDKTDSNKYDPNISPRYIYEGARKAAKKMEKLYGLENLGPWDDFEWGMLNGKLSALRWVLGEDWDELYT